MIPTSATTPVFVYGTLRRNCRSGAWHRLLGGARFLGAARVRGALYSAGPYPALVAAGPARPSRQWVEGELYRLASRRQWQRLDAYEGMGPRHRRPWEYRRARVYVYPRGPGEPLEAWAYLYNRSTARLARIASGDWLRKN